jgi:hypothetical protein
MARTLSNMSREPAYGIQLESPSTQVSKADAGFHMLTDRTKLEIYALHKSDESKWTYQALAEKYGMSKARAKAVVYLMTTRDEQQQSLLGESYGILAEFTDEGKEITVRKWVEIFERYNISKLEGEQEYDNTDKSNMTMLDPEEGGDDKVNEEVSSKIERNGVSKLLNELKENGSVSRDFSLNDLHSKMNAVNDHIKKLTHVAIKETQLADVMDKVSKAGYSTSFREIGGMKGSSVENSYYPELFGDNDEGNTIRRLRKMIEADTKAALEVDSDLNSLLESEGENNESSPPFLRSAVEESLGDEYKEVRQNVSDDDMSRWKFAFKDLSEPTSSTMIRTRRGLWRKANALEEMNRSWTRNPGKIDIEFSKKIASKYADADDDNVAAITRMTKKLERKKLLLANARESDE